VLAVDGGGAAVDEVGHSHPLTAVTICAKMGV
jgi:hypothetical protein